MTPGMMHVIVMALDRGQRGAHTHQIHARRSLVPGNQVTGHSLCLQVLVIGSNPSTLNRLTV
jgi:hypothetical protein